MLNQIFSSQNILTLPVFLIMITVLVAAHEYGHYLFARIFGMGIEEFSIGFGKPYWIYAKKKRLIPLEPEHNVVPHLESFGMHAEISSRERKMIQPVIVDTPEGPALEETTNFTLRALPLGGFVRIKGMLPEADGSETKIPGGFYSKPPWQRFIVLLAGPVFSILAGSILIFLLFAAVGEPKADPKPVIGLISVGSPAEAAGLKPGDRLISVDSKPVATFYDAVVIVRDPEHTHHTIVYSRNGKLATTQIDAVTDADKSEVMSPDLIGSGVFRKQARIGAGPSQDLIYHHVPLTRALNEAVTAPARAITMMGQLIVKPKLLKDNLGGPITMVQETRTAVSGGPPDVIGLAAILSISVGILNLLPFPPLDGGQMAFAIAEMFRRGRRLSFRVQNIAAATGFALIGLLFLFVMTVDLGRLGPKQPMKFSDRDKVSSTRR